MDAPKRLVVDGISAFRGDRLVIDHISFEVSAGGALVLLGPNGAGKSTLLRMVAGLKRLDGGRVLFDGSAELEGKIAYLGHQDAIKPGLTAVENLAFTAHISGRDIHRALEALGIAALASVPARMLSAGQKRRLALARLSLTSAPLWLLDEPTLGVDAGSVEAFGRILADHRKAGGIVLATTHVPLPMRDAAQLHLG